MDNLSDKKGRLLAGNLTGKQVMTDHTSLQKPALTLNSTYMFEKARKIEITTCTPLELMSVPS